MKEIIILCGAGIITAVASAALRKHSPEISILTAAAGGLIILLAVMPKVIPFVEELSTLGTAAGIDSEYIDILVKTIGICILGKFTSDFCRDSGAASVASKVELASKLSVIIISLPLYSEIISIAAELLGIS